MVALSSTGSLTPVAPGTATVTVKTVDGNYINLYSNSNLWSYKSYHRQCKSQFETGRIGSSPCSNLRVATVDQNGKVHAVARGTAVITVTSVQHPIKAANCTLKVQS